MYARPNGIEEILELCTIRADAGISCHDCMQGWGIGGYAADQLLPNKLLSRRKDRTPNERSRSFWSQITGIRGAQMFCTRCFETSEMWRTDDLYTFGNF